MTLPIIHRKDRLKCCFECFPNYVCEIKHTICHDRMKSASLCVIYNELLIIFKTSNSLANCSKL